MSRYMKRNGLLFSICGLACIAVVAVLSLSLVKAIILILGLLLFEIGITLRIKDNQAK